MNESLTAPVSPDQPVADGNTYTLRPTTSDPDEGRMALASLLERIDTRQKVAAAVVEYEQRVVSNQPYEDMIDADEFRARYGA